MTVNERDDIGDEVPQDDFARVIDVYRVKP
jgi:hypothetical protein